jgi:hypothetical protein
MIGVGQEALSCNVMGGVVAVLPGEGPDVSRRVSGDFMPGEWPISRDRRRKIACRPGGLEPRHCILTLSRSILGGGMKTSRCVVGDEVPGKGRPVLPWSPVMAVVGKNIYLATFGICVIWAARRAWQGAVTLPLESLRGVPRQGGWNLAIRGGVVPGKGAGTLRFEEYGPGRGRAPPPCPIVPPTDCPRAPREASISPDGDARPVPDDSRRDDVISHSLRYASRRRPARGLVSRSIPEEDAP